MPLLYGKDPLGTDVAGPYVYATENNMDYLSTTPKAARYIKAILNATSPPLIVHIQRIPGYWNDAYTSTAFTIFHWFFASLCIILLVIYVFIAGKRIRKYWRRRGFVQERGRHFNALKNMHILFFLCGILFLLGTLFPFLLLWIRECRMSRIFLVGSRKCSNRMESVCPVSHLASYHH